MHKPTRCSSRNSQGRKDMALSWWRGRFVLQRLVSKSASEPGPSAVAVPLLHMAICVHVDTCAHIRSGGGGEVLLEPS
jgi:hypothetical protein